MKKMTHVKVKPPAPTVSPSQRLGQFGETLVAQQLVEHGFLFHPVSSGNDFGVDGRVECVAGEGRPEAEPLCVEVCCTLADGTLQTLSAAACIDAEGRVAADELCREVCCETADGLQTLPADECEQQVPAAWCEAEIWPNPSSAAMAATRASCAGSR